MLRNNVWRFDLLLLFKFSFIGMSTLHIVMRLGHNIIDSPLIQCMSDIWNFMCAYDMWACEIELHACRWKVPDPVNKWIFFHQWNFALFQQRNSENFECFCFSSVNLTNFANLVVESQKKFKIKEFLKSIEMNRLLNLPERPKSWSNELLVYFTPQPHNYIFKVWWKSNTSKMEINNSEMKACQPTCSN
jgi:hypothetical protein